MTTRKLGVPIPLVAVFAGAAFGAAGCSTPGPLHLYSVSVDASAVIGDVSAGRASDVPSFLAAGETITGFAYDPFTDHFFLRLAPGNRVRVVDRPARAIKREFEISISGSGDLAVRPRDGHLFFLGADPGRVTETTRLGQPVRTLVLADGHPVGLAFDSTRDRFLVLDADGRTVRMHDLNGTLLSHIALEQPAADALAFDSEKRELYAPLRDRAGEIGVFAESGRFLRVASGRGEFVDVGPRSFIRVF